MDKVFEALKTIKIKCHPSSNPSPIIDEALETVEQSLTEKQDLEKFTRLVVEKNADIDMIKNYQIVIEYNWNTRFERYKRKELTEEEFTFIKEMIEKYGKNI